MASGLDIVLATRFVTAALSNPHNAELIRRLPSLGLPDCWLVAGSLFQAVWNGTAGRPPDAGVMDYDIFYFDAADLSYDAEDRAIIRAHTAFADLGITFDLKNEARVHLWYERRFGQAYPRLRSARDGIDRFLVAGTCIGLAPVGDNGNSGLTRTSEMTAELYAPFGLADAFNGILRPNPLSNDGQSAFERKAKSYQSRWAHLTIATAPAAPPERSRTACVTLQHS